jgi:hypothetical protein
MTVMRQAPLLASWLAALLVGCGEGESAPQTAGGSTSAASAIDIPASSSPPWPPDSTSLSPAQGTALAHAARRMVRFLVGDATTLDTLALADTVELHLPPEGAGTSAGVSVKRPRGALRDRGAWRIQAGSASYSFVPPKGLTLNTARAGTHYNCREIPLASRAPSLASRPHVGVRLEPPEPKSCLDGWNATFVFDTTGARPRLVAALYDQWEW